MCSASKNTKRVRAEMQGDSQETGRGGFAMGLEVEGGGSPPPAKAPYRRVLRDTWPLYLALMFVYVITLSIFPGFLAEDVSSATLTDWCSPSPSSRYQIRHPSWPGPLSLISLPD